MTRRRPGGTSEKMRLFQLRSPAALLIFPTICPKSDKACHRLRATKSPETGVSGLQPGWAGILQLVATIHRKFPCLPHIRPFPGKVPARILACLGPRPFQPDKSRGRRSPCAVSDIGRNRTTWFKSGMILTLVSGFSHANHLFPVLAPPCDLGWAGVFPLNRTVTSMV